jgi:3-oxoadipate enol-lactonase
MNRHIIGNHEITAVVGDGSRATLATIGRLSPTMSDALSGFAFGDVFSRAVLGRRERELATVAVLGAIGGAEPQLAVHVAGALRSGVDRDELLALAEHLTVYTGFPRGLNLLNIIDRALGENGIEPPAPSRIVDLGDHETEVTDTGGDGAPIVLVHALGLDRRMWRDVIGPLAARHRVIAYDLRGHGRAAAAPTTTGLDMFAEDLRRLLDRIGVAKVHLVGLSLGGSIATRFAAAWAERLHSLTIVAATAWGNPAFEARAVAAETDGMAAQIGPTLTRWFTPAALAEDGAAVRWAREKVRRAIVADWAASWRSLASISIEQLLPSIRVPARIIAGEHDASTPPSLMRGFTAIPGATFEVIDGAPHMIALEKPAELAAAILAGLA